MEKRQLDLFLMHDGFWAGSMLKNGRLANGARFITQDDIFTMFATLMRVFSEKTGGQELRIEGDDGLTVVAAIVPTETGEQSPQPVDSSPIV